MAAVQTITPMTLSWKDINVAFTSNVCILDRFRGKESGRTTVLHGVTGMAESGTLTALMGPSGAGKTTLMNVLTQRNLGGMDIKGTVMLNGIPVDKIQSFSKAVGFIQQFDLLPSALTVREHLNFMIALLYHKSMNRKQRDARVESVITQVSLAKCADTLIGGKLMSEHVSGGERKRVCIASQLLSNPSVLILDEPTTGMDSYIASLLLGILHDLAVSGYTILCTVHQPSSRDFNYFDRLDLLVDGKTAYTGPRQEAVGYFERQGFPCPVTFSPADFFIDVLTRKPGEENQTTMNIQYLCGQFKQSPEAAYIDKKMDNEIRRAKSENYVKELTTSIQASTMLQASLLTQFFIVLSREWRGIFRLPQRIYAQLFSAFVMTSFMSVIFWYPDGDIDQGYSKNSFGVIVILVSFIGGGLNVMGMMEGMVSMLPLVVKEYRDGIYKAYVYYAAAMFTEIMFTYGQLVLCFFPLYYASGLHQNQDDFATPMQLLLICMFSTLTTVGFSATLIFIGETVEVCMDLFMTIFLIFYMLCGYYKNMRTMDDPILTFVSWFNWLPWSIEWAAVLQWRGVENIVCEYAGTENENICLSTGAEFIYKLGLEDQPGTDAAFMAGQTVFYHVLAITIMIVKMRRKFAG